MADPIVSLAAQLARAQGLDPRAVLAVAHAESGLNPRAVGDQGTSFGLFQLHRGGALPQGRDLNWAASPEGVKYAIRQIAGVAKGLTGRAAIDAIVRKFERPADPDSEITRAMSWYGQNDDIPGGTSRPDTGPNDATPPLTAAQGPSQQDRMRAALAASLLQKRGMGRVPQDLLTEMVTKRLYPQPTAAPELPEVDIDDPRMQFTQALKNAAPKRGALAEAFYDPLGQYDNGRYSEKGIGGHGKHVHASITDPQAMLLAIKKAREMGLDPRENWYSENVDPVHTEGSFHYQDFPGRYDGKRLSKGVDVSGDPAKMAAYFRWLLATLR